MTQEKPAFDLGIQARTYYWLMGITFLIILSLVFSTGVPLFGLKKNYAMELLALIVMAPIWLLVYYKFTKFVKSFQKMIMDDMDLERMRRTIEKYQDSDQKQAQLYLQALKLNYYHMVGDFPALIDLADSLQNGLMAKLPGVAGSAYIMLIFVKIQTGRYSAREDMLAELEKLPFMTQKSRDYVTQECQAAYDILVDKKSNDWFLRDQVPHKYNKLQCDYFQAHNLLLKGERDQARALFEDLARENDQLYLVRESQKVLEQLQAQASL